MLLPLSSIQSTLDRQHDIYTNIKQISKVFNVSVMVSSLIHGFTIIILYLHQLLASVTAHPQGPTHHANAKPYARRP